MSERELFESLTFPAGVNPSYDAWLSSLNAVHGVGNWGFKLLEREHDPAFGLNLYVGSGAGSPLGERDHFQYPVNMPGITVDTRMVKVTYSDGSTVEVPAPGPPIGSPRQ